jgi:riboflavin synthase
MFTGIVEERGHILQKIPIKSGITLEIQCSFNDLKLGDSVAVDGVCLTVTELSNGSFQADVSPETLRLTRMGQYNQSTEVNLERPLKFSDRLGGHYVTGHVDQTARVLSLKSLSEYLEVGFSDVLPSAQGFLVKKGSVTVNGVSLTVNEVYDAGFSVCLIPHTLEKTNLSQLKVGDEVNLEFDWMGKMIRQEIERVLPSYLPNILKEKS